MNALSDARSADPASRVSVARVLFNPFYYLAGGPALGIGLALILAAGLIGALSQTHFDGVLDFHTGLPAPWWIFPAEGVIDWLALILPLYLAGRLLSHSRGLRLVDVLGTQALARAPYLVVALAALLPGYRRTTSALVEALPRLAGGAGSGLPGELTAHPADLAVFCAAILVSLAMLIWMVALMYRAYAFSCNLQGAGAIVSFIVAVIVGEILAKAAFFALLAGVGGEPTAAAFAPPVTASTIGAGASTATSAAAPAEVAAAMIDALARDDAAGATRDFDATMKRALSPNALQKIWQDLATRNGAFQKRLESRHMKVQGFDVVLVKCQFAKRPVTLQVTVSAGGEVSGFHIR
ncbi:MAG: DUF3887 domain-containing protein [bacterium]|nr:DUF3887 domain-containing protein [bacterium]